MDLVIRAVVIYVFILVIMRISGKRQFSQITTFDFVLLLIISEAVSQGIYGSADYSLTGSLLLVTTVVSVDILLSHLRQRFRWLEDLVGSKPTHLIQEGKILEENLQQERLDEGDILVAARRTFGLESLKEVRHAVLESDGAISIIPYGRRSTPDEMESRSVERRA